MQLPQRYTPKRSLTIPAETDVDSSTTTDSPVKHPSNGFITTDPISTLDSCVDADDNICSNDTMNTHPANNSSYNGIVT